jgi:DNA modification methylase
MGMIEPYYQDNLVTIYHGDCAEIVPQITFNRVVSDPPYGVGLNSGQALSKGEYDIHDDSPDNYQLIIDRITK